MVLWLLVFSISIAVMAVSAGAQGLNGAMAYVHMAVAAFVSLIMALLAIREILSLARTGAGPAAVATVAARNMGFVWSWGALGLLSTYGTGILRWTEWWQFLIAFVVAAGLCLFFAAILKKDAETGSRDETFLKLGRILTIVQFVGMVAVMLGLAIDGKMPPNLNARVGWEDWAANHIFFFGAMALAAISAIALRAQRAASVAATGDEPQR
jgi:hypothetical protein